MNIESLENKKVKEWAKLKEKKERDKVNLFLIEGDHLLKEALKKGVVKEIVAINEKYKIPEIPIYLVSEKIIKKLSSQVSSTEVIAVCKKMPEKEITGNVCLLDNIQDPGNLGTIIRSALAFGIETLIVSPDTVDVYNEKTIRASEGMLFHINIIKDDIEESIKKLKEKKYTIYGTNVKTGKNIKEIEFPHQSAIIIGNEGKGMRKELESLCDFLLHIPLNSSCESLNASIAASIIFYEMRGK